jgi:hypothetical protein
MARLALWIGKPPRFLARKADDQNIVPAVAIHVVGECQKVLRVHIDVKRLRRVKLKPLGKIRPRVPIRAGDNIHLPVPVEVAVIRPLAKKLIRKLNPLKRMQRVLPLGKRNGPQNKQKPKTTEYMFEKIHDLYY